MRWFRYFVDLFLHHWILFGVSVLLLIHWSLWPLSKALEIGGYCLSSFFQKWISVPCLGHISWPDRTPFSLVGGLEHFFFPLGMSSSQLAKPLHISEFLPRSGREPRRAPMRKEKKHDVSASQLSHPEPFWVIWHFCALIALKNQSSCDQCGAHPILVPFLHVLVVLFSFSGLSIQAVHPSISVLISPFRLVESVEYLGFLLVFSAFSVDDHSPFRCLDRHVRPVRWVPTHWAALSVTSRAKPLVLLPVGEEVKDGSDETGHTCNMYVESMYMIYVSTTYMIYVSM